MVKCKCKKVVFLRILRKDNDFTPACHSVRGGGRVGGASMAGWHAWQGGGMRGGGGHEWQGGMGHAYGGGRIMHGRTACVAGGMHGRGRHGRDVCVAGETATAEDSVHPTGMHSCFCVQGRIQDSP